MGEVSRAYVGLPWSVCIMQGSGVVGGRPTKPINIKKACFSVLLVIFSALFSFFFLNKINTKTKDFILS